MNPGKWYYIRVVTFILFTCPWVLSVFMHLIVSIRNNADIHLSEDVALMVAFTGVYYMTIIYVKKQPKVAFLLRDLSYFQFGKPPGFDETERILGFLSKLTFCYSVMAVVIYNYIKYRQKPECERMNKLKGLKENCGMLTPTWWPFEINYSPAFQLIFLYIFTSTQVMMKLSLMISFNVLEMAHHIILRINHLKTMILESLDEQDYEASKRKIKTCILYHLEILGFAERMDDCFSNGMFAHLTITAAICGCLEKQFVDGDNQLGSLLHIFGWILALFLACLGGQHLINASETISDAIWSSKWYDADLRLRKDLIFMMARSQVGLYLNVGGFGILSYALFLSVIKMSYSILAMLTS
nr:PREDICTED: putative odorant receptor 71a [Tribolium castaneum]|eukprot:XP_015834400.1 PREDICTED: putative odorant receptor 71a [Tribolium castaneum]